jgi:putative oxidoreductase
MRRMHSFLASLSRFRDVGILIIRLAFGLQLIIVSWPYIIESEKQNEFVNYLATLGFPFPKVGSVLSVYTEFIGGILLLFGLLMRPAAILLIINFLVAVFLAHLFINDTYQNTFPAANLLAVSIFFLFNGAGNYSIDARLGLD